MLLFCFEHQHTPTFSLGAGNVKSLRQAIKRMAVNQNDPFAPIIENCKKMQLWALTIVELFSTITETINQWRTQPKRVHYLLVDDNLLRCSKSGVSIQSSMLKRKLLQ